MKAWGHLLDPSGPPTRRLPSLRLSSFMALAVAFVEIAPGSLPRSVAAIDVEERPSRGGPTPQQVPKLPVRHHSRTGEPKLATKGSMGGRRAPRVVAGLTGGAFPLGAAAARPAAMAKPRRATTIGSGRGARGSVGGQPLRASGAATPSVDHEAVYFIKQQRRTHHIWPKDTEPKGKGSWVEAAG